MISSRRRSLGTNLALAFFTVVAIGLVSPIFFTVKESKVELHGVAVHAATADSFKVGAPIRIFSKPQVVIEHGTVALTPTSNGRARSFDAIAALLKSGGADLVVSDATVTLDGGSAKPANDVDNSSATSLDTMLAPLVAAIADVNFDGLTLRRCKLILKRSDAGEDVFTDVNAELSSMGRSALRAVGSFRFRGEPLTFDVTLGGAKGKSSGVRMPLRATFNGELVSGEIDGLLGLGDQPQVVSSRSRLTITSLGKTARWLGFDWPVASPVERFEALGKLEWSGRAIAFEDARFDLDGNGATGTLSISLAEAMPAIDATIAFAKLDVGRFAKKESSSLAAAQIPAPWNSLFAYSTSSSVISQIDSDIRLSADEIIGLPLRVGRAAATVTIKSGKMLADITELEVGSGGDGRGQVAMDANGVAPNLQLSGKLDRLDYAAATTALVGFPALHGIGSISVDLMGSGSSITEIQSSLSGKVDISAPTGGRMAADVRALAAQARANPAGDLQTPVWGQTQFEQLSTRLIFSNGIATIANFKATAGADLIEASGRIALPARTIDLRLRSAPASPDNLVLTKSLPEPNLVRIRGPWSKPVARAATGLSSDSDTAAPQVRPASQPSVTSGPAGLLAVPPAAAGTLDRQ